MRYDRPIAVIKETRCLLCLHALYRPTLRLPRPVVLLNA